MVKLKKNTPVLRFSGFDIEWEEKQLGKEISFLAGFAFDSKLMSSIPSNYQIIKMSNVYQNEFRLDRNPSYLPEVSEQNRNFILEKGDTILTLTGTVGKRDYGYSIMIKESDKYLLNQRLVRLRGLQNKTANDFIKYLVSHEKFLYYFFSNSKGGTGNQSNVSIEDLKTIQLPLPTFPEQQKIASFLTSVDERIQQLTRKKKLLEQYKKGVMQKILSRVIRFKDDKGKDFSDWEEKTLADTALQIIDGDRGNNYPNGDDFSDEGYCLFMNAKNVTKTGFIFEEKSFITKEKDEKLSKGKLNRGDLVLTSRGSVGYVAYYDDNVSYDNLRINSGMVLIRNNDSKICTNFIYKYFTSPVFIKQIMSISFGSAQPQLTVKEINRFKLNLPSFPEQKKIADFLTSIDKKIALVNTQLQKTQAWKKGLLQKMFV